jgi:hypothetical protein
MSGGNAFIGGVRGTATALLAAAGSAAACHPAIKSTLPSPPTSAQLAQLWIQPDRPRDLYWGVGGQRLAPDPSARYTVIQIKRSGFSQGYTVKDKDGRSWSVKFPPEAATEVKGIWSYYRDPFVGTPQLQGLLVLQAMLGNSDLKDDNNAKYELSEDFEGARTWYGPRDLGHTFGRTGILDAPRGDIQVFEHTPFITGVVNGRVNLDWRGRYDTLFHGITPSDVRWICTRLATLTDRQWQDAFRAGGFDDQTTARFIRRLKQKIAQGLALEN